jgi:hypothetical protein
MSSSTTAGPSMPTEPAVRPHGRQRLYAWALEEAKARQAQQVALGSSPPTATTPSATATFLSSASTADSSGPRMDALAPPNDIGSASIGNNPTLTIMAIASATIVGIDSTYPSPSPDRAEEIRVPLHVYRVKESTADRSLIRTRVQSGVDYWKRQAGILFLWDNSTITDTRMSGQQSQVRLR